MTDVRPWLASRHPRVPSAFRDWLDPPAGTDAHPEALARVGATVLAGVDPSRRLDRDAAFRLLAADAFLTYACEAAADESDVETALGSVLDRVAGTQPHE